MQFNDTTNRSGLIQDCEFWCGFGRQTISGDTNLLAEFTRLINIELAERMAKLQILSGKDGAEDTNYASQQFSFFNIVSDQNDYQFLTDQAGNTITDITGVLILPSATATDYKPLNRLTLSDSDALLIMSPNASQTGTPTGFIEKNNTVFFDKLPDYSATNGGKLFYRLVPSYFVATDTTKSPGFVEGFHRILSLGASLAWLMMNKPEATELIALASNKLKELTEDLATYVRQKNPTATRMTPAVRSSR